MARQGQSGKDLCSFGHPEVHFVTRDIIPNQIPKAAPSSVKKARERSIGVHGARLFNMLPMNIRNENLGDFPLFKNHLDLFLGRIPDQPTTPGLVRAALTNNLLD